MKTDFTILARTRNHENVLKLVQGIEDRGFTTYNFLSEPVNPEQVDQSWEEQMNSFESTGDFWSDPLHKHHFEKDLAGLKGAETAILLLPAGLAAHMEAGVAFGLGKKLILIGEPEKPETLYLMFDEHYPTIEAFLESI